jgi:hypothetical protein
LDCQLLLPGPCITLEHNAAVGQIHNLDPLNIAIRKVVSHKLLDRNFPRWDAIPIIPDIQQGSNANPCSYEPGVDLTTIAFAVAFAFRFRLASFAVGFRLAGFV